MSTESPAIATTPVASPVQVTPDNELALTAFTSTDMNQCQSALIAWCERKIGLVAAERDELLAEAEHARKRKWKFGAFERHAKLADKRLVFYTKIKAALEAGYCIVPTFPVSLFAIRTDKREPLRMFTNKAWTSTFEQSAVLLPVGEGEYKNPNPIVGQESESRKISLLDGQTETVRSGWAESWDALEFPAHMAKLQIMEAADRAMALKVFDEIAMFPEDRRRHPDPILFGNIILRRNKWDIQRVSFLIAWHFNTSTL